VAARSDLISRLSLLFRSSRACTFEFNSTASCSRSLRRRAGRAAWPRRIADRRCRLAAVGAGDDVFSADYFGECDDAIGYQFRVLDEVGGVADNARNQDLPGGEFHVAPDLELSQEKTPDPFSTRLIIDLLCTVGKKQDRILFSFRYKIIEALLLQLVK
jgi:hypothetical protein